MQTLGVLRLGLATVAGQTAGALVIDLVAPAPGRGGHRRHRGRRRAHAGRGRDQRPHVASAPPADRRRARRSGDAAARRVALPGGARSRGRYPCSAMPSARAQRPPWPGRPARGGLAELAATLRAPRGVADELEEARELLAYWEQRARAAPALGADAPARGARDGAALAAARADRRAGALRARTAGRRVAARRRAAHAHHARAPRPPGGTGRAYGTAAAALTLLLVFAAAVAVVAEAALGAL